jgi:hypothetical protein
MSEFVPFRLQLVCSWKEQFVQPVWMYMCGHAIGSTAFSAWASLLLLGIGAVYAVRRRWEAAGSCLVGIVLWAGIAIEIQAFNPAQDRASAVAIDTAGWGVLSLGMIAMLVMLHLKLYDRLVGYVLCGYALAVMACVLGGINVYYRSAEIGASIYAFEVLTVALPAVGGLWMALRALRRRPASPGATA